MKKIFVLVCILFSISAISQVNFRIGVRGGVNLARFSGDDTRTFDSKNGFTTEKGTKFDLRKDMYVGGFGALSLGRFYILQPEINYTQQGSKVTYTDVNTGEKKSENLKISYLSVSLINKFHSSRFNIHIGPTLDVVTERNFTQNESYEVDTAIVLGVGYNITDNIGIEARFKRGILPAFETTKTSGTSYNYETHENVVFQLGAYFIF